MKIRLLRTLCEIHNEPVTPPNEYDEGEGCRGCLVGADPLPGCEPTLRTSRCCGAEVAYGVEHPYCVGCGATTCELNLTLWFTNTLTEVTYPVEFESDPNDPTGAERHALAYMAARGSTHAVYEDHLTDPIDQTRYPLVIEKLYPLCGHGLALWLCDNPTTHYPTDAQLHGGY